VQITISPPPEKPLARIHLCVNGKAAIFTLNIKLTLRIPKVTNNSIPAAGNRTLVLATKDNGDGSVDNPGMDDLELEVTVEADDDHASDGKDALARCACKQAAGMLEEYEEDAQWPPRDEGYQSEWDEDELTSNDIDIVHDAERLAQQQDEAVSNLEDESDDDTSNGSSEVDDEHDADFIPRLKLKAKDKFKATGGEKCMWKVEKDANYMFCPLPHQLPIICLVCKHFCQHPILPERHGQAHTPSQIHCDAVLEAYYHCKANNLREVWGYLWTNWYTMDKWVLWA